MKKLPRVIGGIEQGELVSELSTLGVAKVTYGSNANGRWMKTFDQTGEVIKVEQVMPGSTGAAAVRTKTLPVEMPDENFITDGSSGDTASLGGKRDYVTWQASNTTTTFNYAIRGGSSFEASAANIHAIWIKA